MKHSKVISTLATLLISCSLQAQDFMIDSTLKERYPFVDWSRNRLDFYGDAPNFERLFEKLDSLYDGQESRLNFFHIGGSHIQADIYSHRIRRYLHNLQPHTKGPLGFIFPYTMAGTNNPWNYLVEYEGEWEGHRNSVMTHESTWGLQGITASTTDSTAKFRISNRPNLIYRYNYDRVKLFHQPWKDSIYCIQPTNMADVEWIYTNREGNYTEIKFKEAREDVEIEIYRDQDAAGEFVTMGMELTNDDPGVVYHSIGVNGASFGSYERCELWEEQLSMYKPDFFLISIGTNDTYVVDFDSTLYEERYERMLKTILRANPECAIVLGVPNDSYFKRRYANPHTATAARVIERLAKKYDMAVWNFYEIMGGLGSAQHWYKNKLMPYDRIHFTAKGYDIKGDLFITAFFDAWDRFAKRDTGYLYYKHLDPEDKLKYYSECVCKPVPKPSNYQYTPNTYQTTDSGNYKYYTIRSGDTLWDIAVANGTSVARIQQLNPGINPRNLKIGQRIKVGTR